MHIQAFRGFILMNYNDLTILQIFSITFFGIFFGVFELTTNGIYIITRNYSLPSKQHRFELPLNPSSKIVWHKVVQMHILGFLLTTTAIIALLFSPYIFIVGVAMILINGLIDYTKFHKSSVFYFWIILAILAGSSLLIVI